MESLDLTYNLVVLKIKCKAPDRIYVTSQVFQEHSHGYDKRKNKKIMNLFIFAATHSLSTKKQKRHKGKSEGVHPPPEPAIEG